MAMYKLVSESAEYALPSGSSLIGSFSHCHVVLHGEGVAGEHARLDVDGDRIVLTDLGSPGGTFVDDVRVDGSVPLKPGQVLTIGGAKLRLVRSAGPSALFQKLAPVRSLFRVALWLVAGTLAIIIVGLSVLRMIYNAERVRKDLTEVLEGFFKRDVEIGSVTLGLSGSRLELHDFVIHNLPEFGGEPLAKVDVVRVELRKGRFLGLLGGPVEAVASLEGAAVLIERTERGRVNVGDLAKALAKSLWGAGDELRVRLPLARVSLRLMTSDLTLRLRDDVSGSSEEISPIDLEASISGPDGMVSYRLASGFESGGVGLSGKFQLLDNGEITSSSVRGELLSMTLRGFGTGTPSRTLSSFVEYIIGTCPLSTSLDAELCISAEGLEAVCARVQGRMRGVLPRSEPFDATFSGEALCNVLEAVVERMEFNASELGWEFSFQGRMVPSASGAGAELLDTDISFRSQAKRLPLASWLGARGDPGLDGWVTLHISTTGPTRALQLRAELRGEGLTCAETGSMPEDVSASFRGEASFAGWDRLDTVTVQSVSAEASFLHAALGPGTVTGLAEPRSLGATLGPLEFELDLAELLRRYGPLLPEVIPSTRLHGWADLSGRAGRIVCRHNIDIADEGHLEGTITLLLDEPALPRLQLDVRGRVGPNGNGSPALAAALGGELILSSDEPAFDLTLSGSGELFELLALVKTATGRFDSVWARGSFNLAEASFSGSTKRFYTKGRLELIQPELWGGSPKVRPFSEQHFDALWNLELDFTKDRPAIRANLFKCASSTFQMRLEGEMDDVLAGLGRYDLQVSADLDKLGSVLCKLELLPVAVPFRGSIGMELSANTRSDEIKLTDLCIDTLPLEMEGRGELRGALSLLGLSDRPGPGELAGKLVIRGKLDVGEAMRFVRAFDERPPAIDALNATGEATFEVTSETSGEQLILNGLVDLGRSAWEFGPNLRKSADELASFKFSGFVRQDRARVVALRSGVFTFGNPEAPAVLELSGSFSGDSYELMLRSKRFPAAPFAACFPSEVLYGGELALDVRCKGKSQYPESTFSELDGELEFFGVELSPTYAPSLCARFTGAVGLRRNQVSSRRLLVELRRTDEAVPDIFASIRFERLDLERLGPSLSGTFRMVVDAAELEKLADMSRLLLEKSPGEFSGELVASSLRGLRGRLELCDFSSHVKLGRAGMSLEDIRFSLLGGNAAGSAKFELSDAGEVSFSGGLVAERVRLEDVSARTGIGGAFKGELSGQLRWVSTGSGRAALEKTSIDAELKTGAVLVAPEPFPLAREVGVALANLFGAPVPGTSEIKPTTVRVVMRRGRLSVEVPVIEFTDGLKLSIRGRSELDGRIAGWVGVEALPDRLRKVSNGVLDELARRGALRFAVTGTWIRPSVDIKGLLWTLSKTPAAPEDSSPRP